MVLEVRIVKIELYSYRFFNKATASSAMGDEMLYLKSYSSFVEIIKYHANNTFVFKALFHCSSGPIAYSYVMIGATKSKH